MKKFSEIAKDDIHLAGENLWVPGKCGLHQY